ncbi:MAG: ribosomal RNA small subunit methyltransferase A [Actinobacteria bacterium]|nr:ribosomal RNA small subunit methyltransferase A [Actinomycetota bacterium]
MRVRADRPRAKKSLGQHFLVDENFLGVIERLAELEPGDIVLEIGPGYGVLTRHLAERVETVHAIELDTSMRESLGEALQGTSNVHVTFADAVRFEYGNLDPPPTKLVSNLPYNVATPIVVESLERIPTLERWVVMVQREVAERFFASPRTKAYGAVSVLVQLHTRKLGSHRVPSSAFRPKPRVESALVAFERYPGTRLDLVRPVVESAFAHRRKTLANSLAHTGFASRSEAETALADIGRNAATRAEELAPEEFVALAKALG